MASSTTSAQSLQSTPASSPPPSIDPMDKSDAFSAMQAEEETIRLVAEKEESVRNERMEQARQKDLEGGEEVVDKKFKALEYLLNQSKLYSTIMLAQMQKQEEQDNAKEEKGRKRTEKREEKTEQEAAPSQSRATRSAATVVERMGPESNTLPTRGRGRPAKKEAPMKGKISDFFKKEQVEAKAAQGGISDALAEAATSDVKAGDIGMQELRSARQPELVSGGTMRTYQLEGLEWLTSLYENGLNGILADEMGLGKTIQTISFLAFLRERGSYGPFLIAAPLSTTSNWVEEFRKWTPTIPVVLYHGSKVEREEIRQKRMEKAGSMEFPVVITSYEICMNDRKFLAGFGWKFIIIDEGHRIKNLNCRLIRELQSYQSANRLLITGTPLQNNLTELWSLLHFLMPTIFDKLESFESWFDFSALNDRHGYEQILTEDRKKRLVASLHAILKPFLLRRVKADVESNMPKKREYVLFAPLTHMQRDLYQAILDGTSRSFLEDKAMERLSTNSKNTPRSSTSRSSLKRKALDNTTGSGANTPNKSAKTSRETTPASVVKARTRGRRQNYEEVSDNTFFSKLSAAKIASQAPNDKPMDSEAEEEHTHASNLVLAKRLIAGKKLQNPMMQLRLCCDSPYNFFNPFEVEEGDGRPDKTLITTSGKMLLLDSLLPTLFNEGHKVLIFSQFKTQLDLLQLYAEELRGWRCCRIDGSVPQAERQSQIKSFNKPAPVTTTKQKIAKKQDEELEEPRNLFLLSTRAGGQGINLASADTVILFDSDWNPQQDLQAQDRAHRIGQTRNVIVYRFATRGTVEELLLEKAEGKRRLEKLVIRKGGLKEDGAGKKMKEDEEEFEELQKLLRRTDGESFDLAEEKEGLNILSKEELRILTDRSNEAYERAQRGLDSSGAAFKAVELKGNGLLESLKA